MESDRISELPDSLITQILLYLETKDSVKTSVLSKRWEFFWLMVPGLDLKVSDFRGREVIESFMDKFMEFNHKSRMQKFKLKSDTYLFNIGRVEEWIGPAVDSGIQYLDIVTDRCYTLSMPLDIYKNNTLVSLKLVTVGMLNPEFVVSLPCLKIIHLEDIYHHDNDPLVMEKLISGCPVLEDLTLIQPFWGLLFLRVKSQTLKSFHHTLAFQTNATDFAVEIDAPQLKYMNFTDYRSDRIVLKNLSSLSMIEIDTDFKVKCRSTLDQEDLKKIDNIRDFLTRISSVRHMTISETSLEVLYQYSKLIPKFNNLYCLEAAFFRSMLQFLPDFLESYPNLKNLILDFSVCQLPEKVELSYVPRCLLLTLECVEMKEVIMKRKTWKKLVWYFIENSVVLKKLILRFKDSIVNQDSGIFKELLTYTKRYRSSCEIIIHGRSVSRDVVGPVNPVTCVNQYNSQSEETTLIQEEASTSQAKKQSYAAWKQEETVLFSTIEETSPKLETTTSSPAAIQINKSLGHVTCKPSNQMPSHKSLVLCNKSRASSSCARTELTPVQQILSTNRFALG